MVSDLLQLIFRRMPYFVGKKYPSESDVSDYFDKHKNVLGFIIITVQVGPDHQLNERYDKMTFLEKFKQWNTRPHD